MKTSLSVSAFKKLARFSPRAAVRFVLVIGETGSGKSTLINGDQSQVETPIVRGQVEQVYKRAPHRGDDDEYYYDDNADRDSDEPSLSHLPRPQVASVQTTKNRRSQAQRSGCLDETVSTAANSSHRSVRLQSYSNRDGDRRPKEHQSQIPTPSQSSSTRSQVCRDHDGTLQSRPRSRQPEPERSGHRGLGYASDHPHEPTQHDQLGHTDDDDDPEDYRHDDDSSGDASMRSEAKNKKLVSVSTTSSGNTSDELRMQCRKCRGMFGITEAYLQWLCSKNLAIPSSCPDCN